MGFVCVQLSTTIGVSRPNRPRPVLTAIVVASTASDVGSLYFLLRDPLPILFAIFDEFGGARPSVTMGYRM